MPILTIYQWFSKVFLWYGNFFLQMWQLTRFWCLIIFLILQQNFRTNKISGKQLHDNNFTTAIAPQQCGNNLKTMRQQRQWDNAVAATMTMMMTQYNDNNDTIRRQWQWDKQCSNNSMMLWLCTYALTIWLQNGFWWNLEEIFYYNKYVRRCHSSYYL